MRVAVAGGVASTEILIQKLAQHGFEQVNVWGYRPPNTTLVSGWRDLAAPSAKFGFPHTPFTQIATCREAFEEFTPDIFFAVGISQIIPADILRIARIANIGFHPTRLPEGRGRAPMAWMVLEGLNGAATFFRLRNGVDDGPIFVQQPFEVEEGDDVNDVEAKIRDAEAKALDAWLPALRNGDLRASEQDHSKATWFARRAPEDGWIDWDASSHDILRLVRASTTPHPGARTVHGETLITVWAARVENQPIRGVVGRIVALGEDDFTVQTGNGLLQVTRWSSDSGWAPRIGVRLGYYCESEILRLRQHCASLEAKLERLSALVDALSQR